MSCRAILVLLLFIATSQGAELRTLKGETIVGDVVSVTDKEIVIAKGADKIATPLAQVLQLDYNPPGKATIDPYTDVELTDGTLLHCAKFALKGKDVELALPSGQTVRLPLTAVSNVLIEAQVEKNRKEWSERLADRKAKMKRRDVLAVRKEGVLNALEGTLGEGDEKGEAIEFTVGAGKKRIVPLNGIAGLIFERGVNPEAAPVVCKITDTSRNTLQASAVASTPAGIAVTTPAGAKIEFAPAMLARLDYSGGKLTWLSDLDPVSVVESFFDGNPFHYLRDRSQDGPIRLDNQTYTRGLSLHAHTELEYDLKGDYREFKAIAGINDGWTGGGAGPTLLRFEGDGKLLKEVSFDRKDKVRHAEVKINIKDVQKLKIVVADGDKGLKLGLGKQIDLGDAKVSK